MIDNIFKFLIVLSLIVIALCITSPLFAQVEIVSSRSLDDAAITPVVEDDLEVAAVRPKIKLTVIRKPAPKHLATCTCGENCQCEECECPHAKPSDLLVSQNCPGGNCPTRSAGRVVRSAVTVAAAPARYVAPSRGEGPPRRFSSQGTRFLGVPFRALGRLLRGGC